MVFHHIPVVASLLLVVVVEAPREESNMAGPLTRQQLWDQGKIVRQQVEAHHFLFDRPNELQQLNILLFELDKLLAMYEQRRSDISESM